MRLAITIACDRLDWALTQRAHQALGGGWGAHAYDNPLPAMTIDQCIHLVTLHQNRDRLRGTVDRSRYAEGAPPLEESGQGRPRRRAEHYETTGDWRLPEEPPPPALPPLHLVTGWSKANPDRAKVTHNPNLALFGGWRLSDYKKRNAKPHLNSAQRSER